MTGRRPPFLAVVEPEAAEVILRQAGEQLTAYARNAVAYQGTPAEARGRSVLRALAMLQESARQWRDQEVPVVSGPGDVGVEWLSTSQVAEVCQVTDRAVRDWIAGGHGPLPAIRVGRPWRVRADDLEDFRRSRSEVAG